MSTANEGNVTMAIEIKDVRPLRVNGDCMCDGNNHCTLCDYRSESVAPSGSDSDAMNPSM